MSLHHKTIRSLSNRLAKLCRAFAEQRLKLYKVELEMKLISEELAKRVLAAKIAAKLP